MKKEFQMALLGFILIAGIMLDLVPIKVPDGIDKIYHFLGFSVLTISAISTFIAYKGTKYLNSFLIFLLVFGGFAAGVGEMLQKFVAIRECSPYDWATNLLGIAVVVIISYINHSKAERNIEIDESTFKFQDIVVYLKS